MVKKPEVSASVRSAAEGLGVEPPTPEQMARITGAQVVLEPDSAASAGARGVYNTHAENIALRDAGYVEMGLDPTDPSGELTDPDPEAPPPDNGNGGSGSGAAPVNVDVPHVSQTGSTLNCTMGNWEGEPTSYAYAWKIDGASVGSDNAIYSVLPVDVGLTATCTVTATNAAGSTAAPPSVGVVVA